MGNRVEGPKPRAQKQVAALPIMHDQNGTVHVMLITSRETKRAIIPKGWPMKGRKDHEAAATEAREEAGLIGRIHQKPIGSYIYWKKCPDRLLQCGVKVFILDVSAQLIDWPEKSQRRWVWLSAAEAADLVEEPSLATIIRGLFPVNPQKKVR
jgi:8-oxo-dGTP pyrophosphatase MutT (NUDIX family)